MSFAIKVLEGVAVGVGLILAAAAMRAAFSLGLCG